MAFIQPVLKRQIARHDEILTRPVVVITLPAICSANIVVGHIKQIGASIITNDDGIG